jgi:hypothetical protein
VVAPLVHDEDAIGRERGEPGCVVSVVAEGFLAVDGHSEAENLLEDGGVRAGRGRDDRSVEGRQRFDAGDDRRRPALLRERPTLVRAGHDGNVAAERSEVAKDVATPTPAADETDDHRP